MDFAGACKLRTVCSVCLTTAQYRAHMATCLVHSCYGINALFLVLQPASCALVTTSEYAGYKFAHELNTENPNQDNWHCKN